MKGKALKAIPKQAKQRYQHVRPKNRDLFRPIVKSRLS